MIKNIHHVQITIPKGAQAEAEARQFYVDVMQLKPLEKPKTLQARGGFWLQIGNQEIHIGVEADVNRHKTKAHIAYEVTDIAYWRHRLEKAHIKVIESIAIPGYDRFECRDPFGNRMEFITST